MGELVKIKGETTSERMNFLNDALVAAFLNFKVYPCFYSCFCFRSFLECFLCFFYVFSFSFLFGEFLLSIFRGNTVILNEVLQNFRHGEVYAV